MRIAPWQPGDETAIIDLFASVFGQQMSPEFWRWRYCDHPSGGPLAVLAWDGDRLAAHYAASHGPLRVNGVPTEAALSMTTMTHSDYRGQGLFERTAETLYATLADMGKAAVWGFPNRMSSVPFRKKLGCVDLVAESRPDVFNHNLETVRERYLEVRPGADYDWSLSLLQRFKAQHPDVPTKSGIMLGLGETLSQVHQALRDLRAHDVDMVTIGQYLQPSAHHHPVVRYWTPDEFDQLRIFGDELGFSHVASGPLVRSSYHADRQAHEAGVTR